MMNLTYGGMLVVALLPSVVHSDTAPQGRDPFLPITGRFSGEDAIAQWRLEGLIGHSTRWSGWLSAPRQGWVMVNVGDAVANTGWVVSAINEHGVQIEKRVMDSTGHERSWTRKLPAAWSSQSIDTR
ncbi:MAG: HofP DNA utilization family protein [Symbiopectobacterium sp.]|uniref:HofP DNA utilization family protein n=1 Tax=Symbiopectobacterium sp. TaxID=2952789 RepID=UPI0039E89433